MSQTLTRPSLPPIAAFCGFVVASESGAGQEGYRWEVTLGFVAWLPVSSSGKALEGRGASLRLVMIWAITANEPAVTAAARTCNTYTVSFLPVPL